MPKIIIRLPYPSQELFPNRANGNHWSKTSGLKKQARKDAFYLTKEQVGIKTLGKGDHAMTITFAQSDKTVRDIDNCFSAGKAFFDGMSDALKVNDRQFHPVTLRREYGSAESHMLIIIHEKE